MVPQFVRAGVLAAAGFGLTACASAAAPDFPAVDGYGASIETPSRPLQCVPYARARSGIDLHGDATMWWELADGRYNRSTTPSVGSVVVLSGYGPKRGHVAVVTAIDSPRQIRVDHANWLNDGRIYQNDPVVDVSPDNDWSEVRVWDTRDNVLGSRIYTVRGFISATPDGGTNLLASRE